MYGLQNADEHACISVRGNVNQVNVSAVPNNRLRPTTQHHSNIPGTRYHTGKIIVRDQNIVLGWAIYDTCAGVGCCEYPKSLCGRRVQGNSARPMAEDDIQNADRYHQARATSTPSTLELNQTTACVAPSSAIKTDNYWRQLGLGHLAVSMGLGVGILNTD